MTPKEFFQQVAWLEDRPSSFEGGEPAAAAIEEPTIVVVTEDPTTVVAEESPDVAATEEEPTTAATANPDEPIPAEDPTADDVEPELDEDYIFDISAAQTPVWDPSSTQDQVIKFWTFIYLLFCIYYCLFFVILLVLQYFGLLLNQKFWMIDNHLIHFD